MEYIKIGKRTYEVEKLTLNDYCSLTGKPESEYYKLPGKEKPKKEVKEVIEKIKKGSKKED